MKRTTKKATKTTKTYPVSFRLDSQEEMEALEALAEQDQRSRSSFLRVLVLREIKKMQEGVPATTV